MAGGQAPPTPPSPPKTPKTGRGVLSPQPAAGERVTLTLGPTRPGAPASPGTPCGGGKTEWGVSPGGCRGSCPPLCSLGGGKNGASPDLRVCRSLRGDLVARAAPAGGTAVALARWQRDPQGRGLGVTHEHHPDPSSPNPPPSPCAHLEAGGTGGSLLSSLARGTLWDGWR